MGSFEEEGELQARARARDAVRSLRVHVPTARAWRLQVGQGADPGVRHLRRVQAPAAILTRATSRPGPLSRDRILELPPTGQSSSTAPRIRRSAEPLRHSNSSAQSKFSSWARRSAPFRSTSPPVNSTSQPSQPHRDPARGCRPLVESRHALSMWTNAVLGDEHDRGGHHTPRPPRPVNRFCAQGYFCRRRSRATIGATVRSLVPLSAAVYVCSRRERLAALAVSGRGGDGHDRRGA